MARGSALRRPMLMVVSVGVAVYLCGFFGVVFMVRSDSEFFRIAGINLNAFLYQAIVDSTAHGSFAREVSYRRFKWLCKGYERTCKVEAAEKQPLVLPEPSGNEAQPREPRVTH